MRLIRPVLGMLLLTIGLPALLAGGCLWAALRHRDAGGAFSAELQRLDTSGYAIVVPDVDRLLRDDASFARIGDTELRVTALTADGPAFVGLAPAADVDGYLRDVPHTEVSGVQVGTGELPVTAALVDGDRPLPAGPGNQDFWTRTGGGALRWTPGELTGDYSLVIMNATGDRGLRLNGTVEARPGWLDPAAWGLISLGTILLMAGIVVLALPGRRREFVYVVEPSQVPDLMLAIGAPIPLPALESGAQRDLGGDSFPMGGFGPRAHGLSQGLMSGLGQTGIRGLGHSGMRGFGHTGMRGSGGGMRGFGQGGMRGFGQGGAHRPRTLADSRPDALSDSRPGTLADSHPGAPADPHPARPPALPQFAWPPNNPAGDPLPTSSPDFLPGTPMDAAPESGSPSGPAVGILPGGMTPVVPGALPIPAAVTSRPGQALPDSNPPRDPSAGAASAAAARAGSPDRVPGAPLSLLGENPIPAILPPTGGATPSPAARQGRRRLPAPTDLPEFHATAVGAWVAQTAPERARQTEAQAAAALAEAARIRAAKITATPELPTPQSRPSAIQADTTQAEPARAEVVRAEPVPAEAVRAESVPSPDTAKIDAAETAKETSATDSADVPRINREPESADEAAKAPAAEPVGKPANSDGKPQPEQDGKAYPHQAQKDRTNRRAGVWPAPAPRRVALLTGPNATDWSATGLTRMGGSRPSPKPTRPEPSEIPSAKPADSARAAVPAKVNAQAASGQAAPGQAAPGQAVSGQAAPGQAAQGAARVTAASGAAKVAAAQGMAKTVPVTPTTNPVPAQATATTEAPVDVLSSAIAETGAADAVLSGLAETGAADVRSSAIAETVAATPSTGAGTVTDEASPSTAEASAKPATSLVPPHRQRTGKPETAEATSGGAPTEPTEDQPGSKTPTEPMEDQPGSKTSAQPIENHSEPDSSAQPTRSRPDSAASVQPIGNDPDSATQVPISTRPESGREGNSGAGMQSAAGKAATGTVADSEPDKAAGKPAATEKGQKEDTTDTETEKREEPKPPIVPFPTRQPTTPSHPVPTARSAEPIRPSIHEAEAANSAGGRSEPDVPRPASGHSEPDLTHPAGGHSEPDLTHPAGGHSEPEKTEPGPGPMGAGPARGPLPKQTEANRAGDGAAALSPPERPSIHAAEGGTGEPEQEPRAKTASKPASRRTDPKRAAEPNRPLSRAQDRLSGTAAGRQPSSATGRKVPAAWLKAAESVAARAAAQPTPSQPDAAQPTPDQPDAAQPTPSQPDAAQPTPDQRNTDQPASGHVTSSQPASHQVEPAEATPLRKPRPRTATPRSAADKAAGKGKTTLSKPPAEKTDETTKPSPRTPSYREEAAELLGTAGGEPKRRRAAAPRTSARSRPKEAPDEP